jgi:hypothetical protein
MLLLLHKKEKVLAVNSQTLGNEQTFLNEIGAKAGHSKVYHWTYSTFCTIYFAGIFLRKFNVVRRFRFCSASIKIYSS